MDVTCKQLIVPFIGLRGMNCYFQKFPEDGQTGPSGRPAIQTAWKIGEEFATIQNLPTEERNVVDPTELQKAARVECAEVITGDN